MATLAITLVAGRADASAVTCPVAPLASERVFTLDTTPDAICYASGQGNISGNNDTINDTIDGLNYWVTIDKSDDNTSGTIPNALTVTGGPNSGSFSFLASVWSTYDRILVALKSGEGQKDPDWAAFELVPGPGGSLPTSGDWTISSQGLSHVNLYGHVGDLHGQGDPLPTPEPASLVLFGSGVAFAARQLRRRKA